MPKINYFDLAFFVIGVFLVVFSLYLFLHSNQILKNYSISSGELQKTEDGKTVIAFQKNEYNTIYVNSIYNNILYKMDKDKNISLLYNKENEDIVIKSFLSLWIMPILVLISGGILIIMELIKLAIIRYGKEQSTLN